MDQLEDRTLSAAVIGPHLNEISGKIEQRWQRPFTDIHVRADAQVLEPDLHFGQLNSHSTETSMQCPRTIV